MAPTVILYALAFTLIIVGMCMGVEVQVRG
jgi:hypothetical protein